MRSSMIAVPPFPCPGCGKKLDAVTIIRSSRTLKPGDVTLCAYCACFLIFAFDMTLREISAEELLKMPDQQRNALVRASHVVLELAKTPPTNKEIADEMAQSIVDISVGWERHARH